MDINRKCTHIFNAPLYVSKIPWWLILNVVDCSNRNWLRYYKKCLTSNFYICADLGSSSVKSRKRPLLKPSECWSVTWHTSGTLQSRFAFQDTERSGHVVVRDIAASLSDKFCIPEIIAMNVWNPVNYCTFSLLSVIFWYVLHLKFSVILHWRIGN